MPINAFAKATFPYRDRIHSYFTTTNFGSEERFNLWIDVMGTFTDEDRNRFRFDTICLHLMDEKKVLIVIPERANPKIYLSWFEDLARRFGDDEDKLRNVHIIFSGCVVDQIGTDGKFHSVKDLYGEFNASAMDEFLREESDEYDYNFPHSQVTCENISKNTGDQACVLANMIVGSSSDLVVFLGPCEHVPRFALTVHHGIRTYEKCFRGVYRSRLEKIQILVYPIFRDGGWDAMTDMKGMTCAMDAFGPLDTDEDRLRIFPKKVRGRELVERIGEEMYGQNASTFIMNVTTLEDALSDPLFALEFDFLNT